MSKLSAELEKGLYESLSAIAADLPPLSRCHLLGVWRQVAWRMRDTSANRQRRANLRRMLSDLVIGDWAWVLAVMTDDGASEVLGRWARDTRPAVGMTEPRRERL